MLGEDPLGAYVELDRELPRVIETGAAIWSVPFGNGTLLDAADLLDVFLDPFVPGVLQSLFDTFPCGARRFVWHAGSVPTCAIGVAY